MSQQLQPSEVGEFDKFVKEILPLMRKYVADNADQSVPLFNLIEREDLYNKFYNCGGDLPLSGIPFNELKKEIELILKYTMRTSKAKFLGKLYSGSDSISQFATLLLGLVNTNVHTFDAAPSLTVIEKICINNLSKLFYKNNYINTRGGVIVPGGAYANALGIRAARDQMFPDIIENGYNYSRDGIPILLTSDQSHYTVETTGVTLGIGKKNIIKIKTNLDATININELKNIIEKLKNNRINKYKPFVLCATAGTTVFGAFDNFIELNKICKDNNIWLHIDACWGGSAVFCRNKSKYLNSLCKGIEYGDSITFSAHKTISVGCLTAVLLVKNEKHLIQSCTPTSKQYLFHGNDEHFDNKQIMDISLKTLQCGRTGDGIRLYLSWLYYGSNGLGERVLNAINNAQILKNLLINNDINNFELVIDSPHYCNVCYWYVPINIKEIFNEWKYKYNYNINYKYYKLIFNTLDKGTKLIYKQLKKDGQTYTDFSSLPERGLPSFIRMVTHNYRLKENGVISVMNDVNKAIKSINKIYSKGILSAKL
eukprot:491585_1